MKAKTFILTFLTGMILTVPVYASPEYSEETKRLMQEAGLGQEHSLEDILRRQEALKSGQANNSTPTSENGQNKANSTTTRRIKGGVDEYRVVNGGGQQSVKVTDTEDELHIYSNEYSTPSNYGAKYSYDEFKVYGSDTPANDGHDESTWGELHINRNYRQNVYYEPEKDKNRLEIDEYRLPWQMN